MEILAKGLSSGYEVEHLARVFFPGATVRKPQKDAVAVTCTRGALVYARMGKRRMAAGLRTAAGVCRVACASPPSPGENAAMALCRLLYALLKEATGLRPPWGLLTGVRPLSLLRKRRRQLGQAGAAACLRDDYDVSAGKLALITGIAEVQAPILAQAEPPCYSLYISIPFCPTRCAYCSFVSRTIAREGHLIEPYLEKLEVELAQTAAVAKACGLKLHTIYIGGGTPTALDEPQLEKLLRAVARHFDTAGAAEYTVEAGRPDCTTPGKLALLKAYGVGRVSINPQTMSDGVLKRIGRAHTAQQVRQCYADAQQQGFDSVNMDLIAGLPGDTGAGFAATLDEVLALAPGNITLHTLTLKRSSDLGQDARAEVVDSTSKADEAAGLGPEEPAPRRETNAPPSAVLEAAYPRLAAAGYRPYYLYRQKSGLENLENTGWAIPGQEGAYNVCIMEEVHSILACGAGAVTKLVKDEGATISRRYNYKFPADYLINFDEVIERKKGVMQFYAGNLDPQTIG